MIYTEPESTSDLIIKPIADRISSSLIITFAVTNISNSPITITTVADRLAGPVVCVDDANGDNQVSVDESWLYTVSHALQSNHALTSTVTVTGMSHRGESLVASIDYLVYLGEKGDYIVNIFRGYPEGHFRPDYIFARVGIAKFDTGIHEVWPSLESFFIKYVQTEVVEVEWPKSIEVDQSDLVEVSFIQTEDGGYAARLKSEDNIIIPATPLPAGTPNAPLIDAFGPEYEGFTRAELRSGAFKIELVGSEERSLAQKEIIWKWSIISDKPGHQVLNAIVEVEWRSKAGGDPIKRTSWQQSLEIFVKEPWIGTDKLLLFSVMGLLTGTGFSTPWFYWKLKQKRRLQEYSRQIEWTLATDFDLDDLRVALTDYFDLEELRTLCFKLRVDYDRLRGEGKEGKARELVTHMARRKRIDDLVTALRKARPGLFDDK